MRCTVETHEMQRLKYLCVDSNCGYENKIGCADCFLEFHPGHKKLLVEQFVENLVQKYKEVQNNVSQLNKESQLEEFSLELNKEIDEEFEEERSLINRRLEELKNEIKDQITKKASQKNDFFENFKVSFDQLQKVGQKKFEDLTENEINHCLNFYFDENVSKSIEESQE